MPLRADRSITTSLLSFSDELRAEGVAIGTSELLDAFAVLGHVDWTGPADFKQALAATLAKSQEDHRVFELVFDRFFFRETEAAALQEGVREGEALDEDAAGRIDIDELRRAIARAIQDGDDSALRDLARMAIAAFGAGGDGSGVLGVDFQRIRRMMKLDRTSGPQDGDGQGTADGGLPREEVRRFEELLRLELERARIETLEALPPARPLSELDRALPSGPVQDLTAVHRVVSQLKRRLKTQGHELRGHQRRTAVDMRATMRASLQFGGVPLVVKQRHVRPRRPEIYVLCDVSTSVTNASVFFLSVLHALHDSFRKMRSFVFIERVSEVTHVFESERDFRVISDSISSDAGVADVSGYTDYGRVWQEFLPMVGDELHRRSTLIVLGDARTNGRAAYAQAFATIAGKAGRTFWLNPEPRLYWNYGDSVIAEYEHYCEAFECSTTAQLEDFVKALARPIGR